jgi:leucyl-tRNA synthetase
MQSSYNFLQIEKKWQSYWSDHKQFLAEPDSKKKKYYVLEMLPYPSGRIHMGHVRNYSIGDLIARYKLKQGYNVLHPMGWDSFGLPAENAAIEKKTQPKKWTYENIDNMRSELKRLGFSYDWSKELATCDPDYYKQQQKIFLSFLENDLAYRKESVVNWDPVDQTVLSNEQVEDGRGWRSGALVERKKLTQWFIRITNFSENLIKSLEKLENWPEHVKSMQHKWIGKSYGADVKFKLKDSENYIEIFTTLPETLFGASFCAIAFDHPIAKKLSEGNKELQDFITKNSNSQVSEESIEKSEKLGIDTGLKVINPVDPSQEVPVFLANFVLMDYGTGALFGCPAHDVRDYEFAHKYNLPIKQVSKKVKDPDAPLPIKVEENDIISNSDFLNNLSSKEAKVKIMEFLEKQKLGKKITKYRLRDWGVSRQRYWGCPIPIIHCESCGAVPVPEKDLPVKLPDDPEIGGNGNPLDNHPTWKNVECPKCKKQATRETDTLDTFFDSSWYFLRYCSPKSDQVIDQDAVRYWLPVDKYIGGIEHAVLHLLYARFFVKALTKCGYISIDEPFLDLLTQGMVTHMSYKDQNNKWAEADLVYQKSGKFFSKETDEEVTPYRIEKMSKSKKNVVAPVPIIEKYGADTARLFTLSDSPPEKNLEWTDSGIEGCYKFLNKLYLFVESFVKSKEENSFTNTYTESYNTLNKKLNSTIKHVTKSIESMHFNKSIAYIRELTNSIYNYKIQTKEDTLLIRKSIESSLQLLNPIVPHITEELWKIMGHKENLVKSQWPKYDESIATDTTKKIAIQINGKLKLVSEFATDIKEEELKSAILDNEKIKHLISDKEVRKFIYVPNKLVNIVIA